MDRIRTLIVDDSALVRTAVTRALAGHPEIEVVGTAGDPYIARDKILALDPDVITLDIEMPRMDGLTFLKRIMQQRPMPVVVMSSLAGAGSSKALEALEAGAVEVLAKPGSTFSVASGTELAAKIKAAAQCRFRRPRGAGAGEPPRPLPAAHVPASPPPVSIETPRLASACRRRYGPRPVILIGASTGGTEAIRSVLAPIGADLPGICVVQHIPARFSTAFAARLDSLCALEVREAQSGDAVQSGLALIAPGGHHLLLRWTGAGYIVELSDGPSVHHQRPAVDVLFDSALKAGAGPTALAVLLTGMGADGAAGMLKLREAGARTVVQDEASCVVFGMPREAIRLGAAEEVVPLSAMPGRLERFANELALRE